MDDHVTPRTLKRVATDLAEFFASDTGARQLDLIRLMVRSAQSTSSGTATLRRPPDRSRRRIGIWEERVRGGETIFVRTPGVEPWHLWADEPRLAAKRPRTRRVVLLGESVARGFFYDPVFNPAIALRTILATAAPAGTMDVVDLARTDQPIGGLQPLLEDAMVLGPDAIVIFAGNNWHPAISFGRTEFAEIAARVRDGDPWHQVKRFLESRLEEQVRAFLKGIAAVSAECNVPVVFVLPEGNLVDWRDECTAPLLLDSDATERWTRVRCEAEGALAGGRMQDAAALARELIELDGLTTAVGPSILAQTARKEGRLSEARDQFQTARDTAICWPRPDVPWCYSVVQAVARSDASALGLTLVDLPALFREYLPDDVPGRRLFLDYCHLSVEGVRIATAGIADALLKQFGASPGWRPLARTQLRVAPEADACAHLLAAVHNATWHQSPDVIRHHCLAAVDRWPPIERVIRLFLDFYVRRAPSWACGSFEQLAQLQNASLLTHLFNPRSLLADKPLHIGLVEELTAAVTRHAPEAARIVSELLEAEHTVTTRAVDLLEKSCYLEPFPASPDRGAFGYVRLFERESTFQLVCGEPAALLLTMVHREPATAGVAGVGVSINGVPIGVVPPSMRWRSDSVDIQQDRIKRGLNHVSLSWPAVQWSETSRREEIARRLDDGDVPDVRGVYGELYRLTATNRVSAVRARVERHSELAGSET